MKVMGKAKTGNGRGAKCYITRKIIGNMRANKAI
jgi:hypothetical protein